MNYEELKEALELYYEDLYDEDKEGWEERDFINSIDEFYNDDKVIIPGIGSFEQVDSEEHNDEDCYSIKYFPDHGIWIQITGYYTSYDGANFDEGWDSLSQVFPKQQTITVYLTKEELEK